ncbi:DUF3800 domain-containing protein [Clostridium sp. K25]|uniref:DUF3800 domain-containing protein n=1 Tax=Clostridium sp. K25 TaxID=1443109 RepID=UPI0004DB16D1|nr:DUF3800 domain-containing protein [Clostridium sp. K25]KEI06176.1 hypothetical protein Z957_p0150 [Clostridium sp. K25]
MNKYSLYFDESGNLGTSGRYFVIACIITTQPKKLENKMKKVLLQIKKNYKNIKWHNYELKASSCKPWIKETIYKSIISKDIELAYIVADKIWVADRLKEDKNCLYNYLLSVLLDNFEHIFKNNTVDLILDNKSIKVKSINSFEDYIKIHINYKLGFNCNIHVQYMDSSDKKAYNIQAVDYIANALYAKYEHNYNNYYNIIKDNICCKELFPYRNFGKPTQSLLEAATTKK